MEKTNSADLDYNDVSSLHSYKPVSVGQLPDFRISGRYFCFACLSEHYNRKLIVKLMKKLYENIELNYH